LTLPCYERRCITALLTHSIAHYLSDIQPLAPIFRLIIDGNGKWIAIIDGYELTTALKLFRARSRKSYRLNDLSFVRPSAHEPMPENS